MATINPTIDRSVSRNGGVILVTWPALANGDDGRPVRLCEYNEKTFQATGTLGAGGALAWEGSMDGVTWAALNTKQGTAISQTTLGLVSTQDRPIWVRPHVTAGDGTTSFTAAMAGHIQSWPENLGS